MKPLRFPRHMDVELSNKCNLRCRFCHLSYYKPKETAQFTLENFEEQIEPYLSQMKSITLFNKYEALACKDFLPVFKKLKKYDIETYFSTNGLLLNDEIIDEIVGHLTFLTVSVTGFTPESYERNMGGKDGLNTVKKNLQKLVDKKRERNTPYPKIRISTVAMLDVLDELKDCVDFAVQYEASEGIQATAFKAHGKDLVDLMPLNDPEYFTEKTEEALAYASEMNIKFELQSGSIAENEDQTNDLGHRFCSMPWHRLSVQPNGDVYPCPMSYNPIANLADKNLKDIWEGEELAEFRKGVNDPENMNDDCANCTHCRHRSISDPRVNDFSEAAVYPTGLVRKNF